MSACSSEAQKMLLGQFPVLFSPQDPICPGLSLFLPWSEAKEPENKKERCGVSAHLSVLLWCRALSGCGEGDHGVDLVLVPVSHRVSHPLLCGAHSGSVDGNL